MIDRVHGHIVSEPQQGAQTDTIFVTVAVLLNMLMLAIGSGIAQDSGETGSERRRCWAPHASGSSSFPPIEMKRLWLRALLRGCCPMRAPACAEPSRSEAHEIATRS